MINFTLRQVFFMCCLFFSLTTISQQKKVWTLEQCIEYALDYNISIKQSELDLKSTEIEKKQALGVFFPNLNARASYNWNQGTNINPVTNRFENQYFQSASGGVSASMSIFNGLKNWRNLRQAQLNRLSAEYNIDKIKDDIVLAVVNAYLDILSNKDQLKVLKAQEEITHQNLKRTEDLIEAGALPKGDIYELQAQQASLSQQMIDAENRLFISKMGLAQLLLLEDYQSFEISDESFEVPITDILSQSPSLLISKAKEVRSEIKIAQTNVLLAENKVRLAQSSMLPSLSVGFDYNTRWSKSTQGFSFLEQIDNNKGLSAGLNLSIPIFNGFASRSGVNYQKINVQKSKWNLKQAELNLERNVYQAYNDAINSEKLYNATEKTVHSKKQSYLYAKERYDVGLLNTFAFNQVRLQYENAQTEAVRAKYNYIFKLKVLQYYFGIELVDTSKSNKIN